MPFKDPERRREWQREYQRRWARANRPRYNEIRRRIRERNRAIVAEAKASGCSRCTETDPVCLDLHHVVGKKEFLISRAVSGAHISESRLRAEIAKCIVLCSNCHRKEHGDERAAARRGT